MRNRAESPTPFLFPPMTDGEHLPVVNMTQHLVHDHWLTPHDLPGKDKLNELHSRLHGS